MNSNQKSVVQVSLEKQKAIWSKIQGKNIDLSGVKRILIFGLGSSYHAAQFAAHALRKSKTIHSAGVSEIHAVSANQLAFHFAIQSSDLCIAVTHRGSPGPTLDALRFCISKGAKCYVVASRDVEAKLKDFDFIPTTELETVEPHSFSLTSAIKAITLSVAPEEFQKLWDLEMKRSDPDLSALLGKFNRKPNVLLGYGVGETLAAEAHLKLIEMGSVVARAYSSEPYFHGPHFVHQPETLIWWFQTEDDPRKEKILSAKTAPIVFSVDTHSPLGFMGALIELQWAALALALQLGENPDVVTVGI